MKKIIILYFVLFVFAACHSQDTEIDIPKSNNQFAFLLYKNVKQKKTNLLFSPFSISSAFAMTYAGAQDETKEQIKKVLHFNDNNDDFHSSFQQLIDKIESVKYKDIENPISIANSLWAQKDYIFLDDYKKNCEKFYSAEIENVDFVDSKNREDARKQINIWVEKKTNQKIKELLNADVLSEQTRLVLVNALYFSSNWETPFEEKHSIKDVFYNSGKTEIQTEFMNKSVSVKYYENDLLQIVELPFSQNYTSMVVILPKEKKGLQKLEEELDNDNYELWLSKMEWKQIDVFLPKFENEETVDLKDILSKMGMEIAFSDNADFSKMTGKKDLKISQVIHKSFIKVEESGVEASAATAVVMNRKSSLTPENDAVFKANHPFIYLIKENNSETILFLGAVEIL